MNVGEEGFFESGGEGPLSKEEPLQGGGFWARRGWGGCARFLYGAEAHTKVTATYSTLPETECEHRTELPLNESKPPKL